MDFHLRGQESVTDLDLINVAHASMKILPYVEPSFELVRMNLFFDSLTLRAQTLIKSNRFMKELKELTQSMRISV